MTFTSKCVCACLFACGHRCADVCVCFDRKITTERCSTSNPVRFVFTLFNFAHTTIFRTVLARSSIRRRSSSTCGFFLVPSLGSLASHAHYLRPRGVPPRSSRVVVYFPFRSYCPTRCNGFSCS
uniref:(northern house mosquito) hypothetical protein n=1 Tax=Culex pipiens TaxID=7175 RepID=A0A8D8HDP2_CULPI